MKKLLIVFGPILLLAVVTGLVYKWEAKRPFKTMRIADTRLYIPKKLLVESKADLVNMLRDYVGRTETGMLQLSAPTAEILPASLLENQYVANGNITWTLSAAKVPEADFLADRNALLRGEAPYESRTASTHQITGLTRIDTSPGSRVYSLTNAQSGAASQQTADLWVAQCTELSVIAPHSPWGRCTIQAYVGEILLQIHYDGRLVQSSDTLVATMTSLVESWKSMP